MEEKIKDIFNNIKERLSNPFLFSFLVAFLVYNWEITLAIFYNDSQQIKAEGFKSIFEFVRYRWENSGKIGMPIFIAIVYTFVFPVFRNLVNAFQTWIIKWGEDWNLKISKNSKIGIDKYLALRDNYIAKTKSLEEIIESESKFLIDIENKTKEVDTLKSENLEMKQRINEANTFLSTYKKTNIIRGNWNFTKYDDNNKVIESYKYQINEDKILIINNESSYFQFEILHFYYLPFEKKIQFIKKVHNFNELKVREKSEYFVCDLTYSNTRKLTGIENGLKVQYVKIENEIQF